MITVIPIFIGVIAIIIFGGIIFAIVKSIGTWNSNNNSPILKYLPKLLQKEQRPLADPAIHRQVLGIMARFK